jgi:MFS family permease
VLKSDKNFVRFLLVQVVLSVSECGASFFTYYAIRQLGAGDNEIVWYTIILNASILGSGFLLWFIGKKTGNLNVIRLGAAGSCLALLLVFFFPSPVTICVVFALVGLNFNARLNSFQVFITEFGDDQTRIRYTTLGTAIGAASFGLMPLVGGILLSTTRLSYPLLFAGSAVFAFAAFLGFLFLVKEPRRGQALGQGK